MTDPDARTATLERFEEAAQLLAEARSRVEALAAFEQTQRASTLSINEASTHIVATVGKLDEALDAVQAVLPALESVASAAETALASSDLAQLVAGLAETRALVETAMTDRIHAAETARDEARSQHQKLVRVVTSLPEKVRRKHNLL